MVKPVVLLIIDSLQTGGTEKSLLLHCTFLKNFRPIVFLLFQKSDLLSEFEKSGIEVRHFGLIKSYKFKKIASLIQDSVEEIQPALIQSYLFHSDMTLRYLKWDGPKINSLVSNTYSSRRLKHFSFSTKIKINFLLLWEKFTINRIDLFISNSEIIKSNYSRAVGVSEGRIQVIHRGRSQSDFKPKENLISQHPAMIFLAVGRLISSKGHKDLLYAFSDLLKTKSKITLWIAGDGPEKENLISICSHLGIMDQVQFLGNRNDVAHLLFQADFFVFPSHYEGLPGSIIEAMLTKVPIICSDIPENQECVKSEMCIYYQVGNRNSLFQQMNNALNLEKWEHRTEKAYEFALENFEIEKVTKQHEDVYLELIRNF